MALGGVVFIVVIVLVLLVVCVLYRKRTRAGKHDPCWLRRKGGRKTRGKEKEDVRSKN